MTSKQSGVVMYKAEVIRRYLEGHNISDEHLNSLRKIIVRGYVTLANFLIILKKARNNPNFIIPTEKYKKAQEIRMKQKIKKWKKRGLI